MRRLWRRLLAVALATTIAAATIVVQPAGIVLAAGPVTVTLYLKSRVANTRHRLYDSANRQYYDWIVPTTSATNGSEIRLGYDYDSWNGDKDWYWFNQFFAFDLSPIPAGSSIASATITFGIGSWQDTSGNFLSGGAVNILPITDAFPSPAPSSGTTINYPNATYWPNTGSGVTVSTTSNTTVTTTITSLVDAWISGSLPNNGLAFTAGNRTNITAWPQLTVQYVAPLTSIAATNITPSSATLSWTNAINQGGVQYHLYRNGVLVYVGTATSFTDTSLTPGTSYTYTASAFVTGSRDTDPITVTVLTAPATPAMPSGTVSGLAWDRVGGRGRVTMSWQPVPTATGYKVLVWDGNAYRAFDVGNVLTWDSSIARIYPSDTQLNTFGDNTQTTDLFYHNQGGWDLRDDPNLLYRKTVGTAHDAAHNYWFRVVAYNGSGESAMSNAWTPTLPDRTDPTPPAVDFTINNGSTNTTTSTVKLALAYLDDESGVANLEVSNDNFLTSTFFAPSATLTWNVPAGPGTKTVYVRAWDFAGNKSPAASKTIYVDYQALPPSGQGPTGSVTSSSGTPGTITVAGASTPTRFVNTTAVTLDLTTSGVAGTRYSFDGITWSTWDQPQATRTITLPAGDAPLKAVYVQYENAFGFWSQPYVLYFTVDTTAPVVSASWLGNATATTGGAATLILTANDNITPRSSLQVSTDGGSTWVPYSSRINVTFVQPGWQDFTVMVRDQAGNVSSAVLQIYN